MGSKVTVLLHVAHKSKNHLRTTALPLGWNHPHVCKNKRICLMNDWEAKFPHKEAVWEFLLKFDLRRTLSETIFLVLMRLMTSSWIQEEMEYPLMRTISSPTYGS